MRITLFRGQEDFSEVKVVGVDETTVRKGRQWYP